MSIVLGRWWLWLTGQARQSSVAKERNGKRKANSEKEFAGSYTGARDSSCAPDCASVWAFVRGTGLRESDAHGRRAREMPWNEHGEGAWPAVAWAFAEGVQQG
jgi:hypothetical protein